MRSLAIISVVVGIAGFVLGVIQFILMIINSHKDKKKSPLS